MSLLMQEVRTIVGTVRKVYFYDLENPGTFGVQNRILLDSGTELFKTHKTGIFPGKPGQMGVLKWKGKVTPLQARLWPRGG
jgi:hypothetical protein